MLLGDDAEHADITPNKTKGKTAHYVVVGCVLLTPRLVSQLSNQASAAPLDKGKVLRCKRDRLSHSVLKKSISLCILHLVRDLLPPMLVIEHLRPVNGVIGLPVVLPSPVVSDLEGEPLHGGGQGQAHPTVDLAKLAEGILGKVLVGDAVVPGEDFIDFASLISIPFLFFSRLSDVSALSSLRSPSILLHSLENPDPRAQDQVRGLDFSDANIALGSRITWRTYVN